MIHAMSCNHAFAPLCGCPAPAVALAPVPAHVMAEASAATVDATHLDGWANSLTGIGTAAYDKRTHSYLQSTPLTYQTLIHLRRYDDIGKKVVELVPAECFREGYEISIADEGNFDDVKTEIEQGLRDLEADVRIEQAMRHQRAFGGSAILINVDDGGREITEPVDMNNIHSLDSLNVLEPIEIFPVQFYADPTKPKYGEPEYYQFNVTPVGAFGAGPINVKPVPAIVNITRFVHESRLIVFGAHRASRYQHAAGTTGVSQFWGDPLFCLMVEMLRDYHVSWASAGLLATDLGQPVISIENLLSLVAKDSDLLLKRMRAISLSRSTARAILIDTKEKFERQTTNLSGVPELLHEISNRMAAVCDIPLGLLTGYGSSGVGQTAEVDLKNFFNKIRATQTRYLTPVIRKLGTMIMRSKRSRKLPKNWGVRWNELEHMTDAERAESRRVQGQTDLMYLKGGVVTADEIRKTRFFGGYSYETTVDEKKRAPGFITPLPAGVLPKAMSAEQEITAKEAGNKAGAPAAPGPAGHLVGGYARRNPTAPTLGAMPNSSNGKEQTPMKDSADMPGEAGSPTQGYVVDSELMQGSRIWFTGLPIVIESPKGSVREWTDSDGATGQTKMRYDYGYIEGSIGSDGDEVDVYLGPDEASPTVYVVHQMCKAMNFETYDEDKLMVGWPSAGTAKDAYLQQYDDVRFFGSMDEISIDQLRAMIHNNVGPVVAMYDEADIVEHLDRIVERGGKWVVESEDGSKTLGEYASKEEAIKRLAEIEYWKAHHK